MLMSLTGNYHKYTTKPQTQALMMEWRLCFEVRRGKWNTRAQGITSKTFPQRNTAYTLHRQIRRRFARNRSLVMDVDEQ